ncbi:head-tail connector protein [Planktotalea arctica]|uniref:head-tail connector protein n=1 Tax=Planktotalea arctica TaxID=1481893 RepID=UPI000A176C9B|nr:head-tail connector protein [Planktotalea arctica]
MMLIEEATVPDGALPLAAFKAHLRLGTGFGESDLQEPVLKSFLRAALAAIEARTGKALIAREFSWSVTRWRDPAAEVLPLAPVRAVEAVEIVDGDGVAAVLPPERYALEQDGQRPKLIARGAGFGTILCGGKAVIRFEAGFGAAWDELPSDLAQAVFLLAAHYYEYRDETALARGCMPFGVQTLIERYRPMRLFSGGRS